MKKTHSDSPKTTSVPTTFERFKRAAAIESTKPEKKNASAPPTAKVGTVVPFNPLKKEVLGGAIAEVMLTTPVYSLEDPVPFKGAGIYALYYTGDFPAYAAISKKNKRDKFEAPIYVGQALPAGGRKGLEITIDSAALRSRLMKHRQSIKAVPSLNIKDFHYRVLVLDDTFIRLGESSLIALFAPIWNSIVDGFGNNPPGAGRTPVMSRWDSLHPGRQQAAKHVPRDETVAQIVADIEKALAKKGNLGKRPLITAMGQSMYEAAPLAHLEEAVNLDAPDPSTS